MSYIKEQEYSLPSGNVHANQCFEDVSDIARRNVYCPRNCHQQEHQITGGHRQCNYHSYMVTSDYNSCSDDYILECVEDEKEYILKLYLQEGYRRKCHGYQCPHQSQLQKKKFDHNKLQNINRCNQTGMQRSIQNSVSSASEYYTDELEDDIPRPEKQTHPEKESPEKHNQKRINAQTQECLENKSRRENNHCCNCPDHHCRYYCLHHPYVTDQYDESDTFSQVSDNLQESETMCPFRHQHEHHHHHHHHYHHYYCGRNHDYYSQNPARYSQYYPSYYDESQFGKEYNKYYVYDQPKKPEKYSENTNHNQKLQEMPMQQTQKSLLKNKDNIQDNMQGYEQKQQVEAQRRPENQSESKLKGNEQNKPQAFNIQRKSEEYQQEIQQEKIKATQREKSKEFQHEKSKEVQQEKNKEIQQEKNNKKTDEKNGQPQKPKKEESRRRSENGNNKKRQIKESTQVTKQLKQKRTTNNSAQDSVKITSNRKKMQGGRLLKRESKEKQPSKRRSLIKQTKSQEQQLDINISLPEMNSQNKLAKQQQLLQKAQRSEPNARKECHMNKDCSIDNVCSLDKKCCINKGCSMDKEICINRECSIDKDCCMNKECSVDKDCCMNKECSVGKDCCINKGCSMNGDCCINKEYSMKGDCCINKECSMNGDCCINKECSMNKERSILKQSNLNKDCTINQQCEHRSPEICHGKCQQMVYRLKYCKTHLPYQNSILIQL